MADNTIVMIFKISPSLLLGFGLLERFVLIKIKDLEVPPNLPRRGGVASPPTSPP